MKPRVVIVCLLIFATACFAQNELTLEQSIQIALEKSPVVLKSKADIAAAEGEAGQTVATYLPQLSIIGSIGKSYMQPMTVEFNGTTVTYGTNEQAETTSYGLSARQKLFDGGKMFSTMGMASKGLAVAKHELRKIEQNITFDVVQSYYGVMKAAKYVELSSESVGMAQNHLDRVNALENAGMATKADILRTEVLLAKAELSLTKAKQVYELSKNSFNNLLGRDFSAEVTLATTDFKGTDVITYQYDDLLKIAYEQRPDWQQFLLARGVVEDQVSIAYSGLLPSVSLIGNYERGSTTYPSYNYDTKNWQAILSGSWDILDGTGVYNRIKEAGAQLEAQKASEQSVQRGLALEVKEANFMLKSAKENLAGAQKALELAQENYEIAETRYKSGLGTNLEQIDAQVALTQARAEELDAQHELLVAQARINKVVGSKIY
ncbi:MAG: TolC family protein [bacterium]